MNNKLDTQNIDNFLKRSSFIGLLTLYYAKLKFDKKEAFNKSDFQQINDENYCYGYFIATTATSLVLYTMSKGIINITYFDPYFSEKIYGELTERAEKHDKDQTDFLWKDDIEKVKVM